MPLSKAEYKKRLSAALALNGKTLDQVDKTLATAEWGMGEEAASRAGRPGDEKRQPSRALSKALGQILEVGEDWFEAEDWRPLIGGSEADSRHAIEELTNQRSVLLSTVEQVRKELERLRTPAPPDAQTGEANDNP